MILLLYTTINQMRPGVVIETIHDHILRAREHQRSWLPKLRSAPLRTGAATLVRTRSHGYVVGLRLDALGAAARQARDDIEIVLRVSIGSYVAFGDMLAEVRAAHRDDAAALALVVSQAIRIESQRDLDTDPAYGIDKLAIIGWTSVSTAKSNPSPGLLVVRSLRDILARWSAGDVDRAAGAETVPVVYRDDVLPQLMDALETLLVVASESMQPQTAAEIIRTLAVMFDRLPVEQQRRSEDLVRRSLSALGEHVLTAELDTALAELIDTLERAGRHETGQEVRGARDRLAVSIGKLGSRATRAKGE
jgi:uncharacterized membrane protein